MLDECDDAKISNNNFKSYYIGILNMSGNRNKVENNIFWMADAVANQLLDRGAEYGVVCIAGEENHFIQNTHQIKHTEYGREQLTDICRNRSTGNAHL